MKHARIMQEKHSTPRKIMVDLLDGDVLREFGGISNVSWIIDQHRSSRLRTRLNSSL